MYHTIVWYRMNGFDSQIFPEVLNGRFTWKLHELLNKVYNNIWLITFDAYIKI